MPQKKGKKGGGILFSHKKEKILPFATTWMDFEGIRLSAISRTKTNII